MANNLKPWSWLIIFVLIYFTSVEAKECTNVFTPNTPPTKTLRFQQQMMLLSSSKHHYHHHDHHDHDDHHHVTPTDESTWSSLFPTKEVLGNKLDRDADKFNWDYMYKRIKFSDHFNELNNSFLKEFSLHDVRLDPSSMLGRAQHTNLEYLLMLDVDNLVWSFRKNAGLPTPGAPYGGWESPGTELRGHFVGHYMSATAQMWAATNNKALRKKIDALVAALKECQDAIGTGYLSAFPSEYFDRLEALKPVWAPYYTIHKIMAGLLDQYRLVRNLQALKMVTRMADYFYKRVQNVVAKYSIERHWLSLNEESGGMNDVLYQLFRLTGDKKHLILAHLFDKPCFLGLLAMKADDISSFHSNTHIPIVVGAQIRYELTGDELYKEMSSFYRNENRCYTF